MTTDTESAAALTAAVAPEPAPVPGDGSAIALALKTMPGQPGVYRMLGAKGDVLYVGKARNLKKRVTSYANQAKHGMRIRRMLALVAEVEITATRTEAEALLLESNLIKRLKPRYNILLRDDKSFPYLVIRRDHPWPQLIKYRGARKPDAEYFGPFASAGAVNQTLYALQRAFPLRTCSDAVFANRTRPCLQYQIKRCTGPCVRLIEPADYERLVGDVKAFLSGRSQEVQQALAAQMQEASAALDFEKAATLRDRIRALAHVQARQGINLPDLPDADIVAMHQEGGQFCVQVFIVRAGFNYGNRPYFLAQTRNRSDAEVLAAFLGQFYQNKDVPPLVLLSHPPAEHELLEQALAVKAGRRVRLAVPRRGDRRRLIDQAMLNAREALARRLAETSTQRHLLAQAAERFALPAPPERIEVYDNSHIQGSAAIGAMIVAGPEGFEKGQYRKFTIKTAGHEITPGDDFGMMREVLKRRFARLMKEAPERAAGVWPDLLLIDGGEGQVNAVEAALAELGVAGVAVVGVSKGPDRDAGRERFVRQGQEAFRLPDRDPLLYFLQRLRDEAHRFAIGGHRQKRAKTMGTSSLDEVPGIGARRKRALLNHFGSARAVADARVEDLERVTGVSRKVAQAIHDHFHGDGTA